MQMLIRSMNSLFGPNRLFLVGAQKNLHTKFFLSYESQSFKNRTRTCIRVILRRKTVTERVEFVVFPKPKAAFL